MKKRALIISAGAYQDSEHFPHLKKTTDDAEGLSAVLRNKNQGDFDIVTTLIDKKINEVNRAILKFYKKGQADDLLLLYFCGHGLRDAEGHLYLALVDTEHETLEASALDCTKINSYMERSRSRRQVVILDCCYSGAFLDGTRDAANLFEEAQRQLAPSPSQQYDSNKQQGRFVLSATKKTALAFEHNQSTQEGSYSLYTQALIDGLSKPVAQDQHGNITVNSLHNYVRHKVIERSQGNQHPQMASFDNDGDLLLVKSKLLALPADILELLHHEQANDRLAGITQLKLSCRRDSRMVPAAILVLQKLSADRDRYVHEEAIELLQSLQPATAEEPATNKKIAPPPKEIIPTQKENKKETEAKPTPVETKSNITLFNTDLTKPKKNKKFPLWQPIVVSLSVISIAVIINGIFRVNQLMPIKPGNTKQPDIARGEVDAMPPPSALPTKEPSSEPTLEPLDIFDNIATFDPDTAKPTPDVSSWGGHPAGGIFKDDLGFGDYGPSMVVIPPGEFTMGSPAEEAERENDEGPQRKVTLKAFAIGQSEVTFHDYDRFSKDNNRQLTKDNGWGRGQRPVINVSWNDARDYARWLSRKTGKQYRLPTEAEWEYAARAGTSTTYSTGNCISGRQANFDDRKKVKRNKCENSGLYKRQTATANSYNENAFGLYHMHGNVWEWVEDCWHPNYESAPTNGEAWNHENLGDCSRKMLRGGSWDDKPRSLRSAERVEASPNDRVDSIGFRLVREVE